MRSDDLAARMHTHETAGDDCVAAEVYTVARLDGRGFSRLARRPELEPPLDPRVRDVMIATADHLMRCGFEVAYAYTQSDEISLLLRRDDQTANPSLRRLLAVLVGEASAKATLLFGELACFDCRLSALADVDAVVDHFRWRQAEATDEAIAAHCRFALREAGASEAEAAGRLEGLDLAQRQALLATLGVDFERLPAWQKYGAGLQWVQLDVDPTRTTLLRRLRVELELPHGEGYAAFVREQVGRARAPGT
jgi:tRNA(His) 5'-end guanylyltransferase